MARKKQIKKIEDIKNFPDFQEFFQREYIPLPAGSEKEALHKKLEKKFEELKEAANKK